MVASRLATYYELQTIYGVEDLYNLIEVLAVDSHNQGVARKQK